ncbi:hypothetical protein [Mycolicibacterium brumae]|uniref:hypothetical protein n=1 Tax=Mycolicibacterium brumae TaxID=85968 RepID=UPI000A6A04D8|nr:hypothetical protein [Mycolicibacterium brumae]MCV7193184.1 hypothetical protein [Mycolicibacterium brumae]RWA16622.1 hypothetical protein MBRU_07815 [Mycolicibacterium brumae DSM 44177]UWW09839.1 hypothetical protein L2Z93_002955 [Mycolicibacterium brumae]
MKPYWNGPATGYADDDEARDSGGGSSRYRAATTALYDDAPEYQPEYTRNRGYADDDAPSDSWDYDGEYDGLDEEYDPHYEHYAPDTRWRFVAVIAGIVLLVALIGTAVALRGRDASTVAVTPSPTAPATTPRTVTATIPPSTTAAPSTSAAVPAPSGEANPETVVTVPPSTTAHQNPPADPLPPAAEVDPAVAQRTVTYTVTGNRQLFDLVTVIYTDEQGFPRTDINVALPWTRTVVLNPGVTLKSVTATSVAGQLNCAINDGAGSMLAQQNAGTILAACSG